MNEWLPEHWKTKQLSQIAEVVSGGTPSRDIEEYWVPAEVVWVTPTDITKDDKRILKTSKEKISMKGLKNSSARLLPKGTILMTSRATLGEMKLSLIECSTNQGFKSLIPKKGTHHWFLYYQMLRMKLAYEALGTGSTFLEVNKKDTDSFEVLFPPYNQQQKIAKVLSRVDKLIEKTQNLIDKYTSIKLGIMADLFTRGIDLKTGQLRPSVKDAPELYQQTELGLIPKEWGLINLGDICKKITDGSHQSVKTTLNGEVPFLFVSSVRNGRIMWDKTALISKEDYAVISKGREPKKGDVLYTAVGSYGHAAYVHKDLEFSFQRHIAYIKPDCSYLNSKYLVELLNCQIMKVWADRVALGNAQKTVTLGELSKYPILLPKLSEQKKIINKLIAINGLIDLEFACLNKNKKTKRGLMQDLLTGKVKVN